jgi:putative DNA primase/helicase
MNAPTNDASPRLGLLEALVAMPEHELGVGRPVIDCTNRGLDEITDDALAAIELTNSPPKLFQRGSSLVRLRVDGTSGPPVVEPMTLDSVRGQLARVASWKAARATKGGTRLAEVAPPIAVVRDFMALPGWSEKAIPRLEAVVDCPTFARDGSLVVHPGYDRASAMYYRPAPGLVVPDVPGSPSPDQIQAALGLLVGEFLGDFPFKDEASRTNALALLLLPFVRELIDGPTPLHLIEAAKAGTGKGLFVDAIHIVATGRCAEPMPEVGGDDEWRKRILAALLAAPKFLFIDNINSYIDSGSLASALTARTMKDRVLGSSRTAEVPVRCIWVAAGNNVRMSEELARRTPLIRMVAGVEDPSTLPPSAFRHPYLIRWAKANRGLLVGAALTLCRAWFAAGRPSGAVSIGSFEAWAEVIGGILQVAGRADFMANAAEMRAFANDDRAKWTAFVLSWRHLFGDDAVGTSTLFEWIRENNLLEGILGDGNEQSQRTRLGRALSRHRDAHFGDYKVMAAGHARNGSVLYRVVHQGDG